MRVSCRSEAARRLLERLKNPPNLGKLEGRSNLVVCLKDSDDNPWKPKEATGGFFEWIWEFDEAIPYDDYWYLSIENDGPGTVYTNGVAEIDEAR